MRSALDPVGGSDDAVYFHIKDGIRLFTDDVGKDLKGLDEARREAEMLAAEVRSEMTKAVDLVKELHVEIEDETGRTVAVVKLDEEPPLNSFFAWHQ